MSHTGGWSTGPQAHAAKKRSRAVLAHGDGSWGNVLATPVTGAA